ncbi:MAG: response regulator [Oscillospiraceae bacterium]|jgi:signal transduction histidine kinase/DNA-binding NarL/FixJ family response regulator|nr:response regulator [Oscillospiraceae bacterium]
MRELVGSSQKYCVGCNRCTRECPIETANIAYSDGGGQLEVSLPISCVVKLRGGIQLERKKNEELYIRSAAYIGLIRQIGDSLVKTNDADFPAVISSALRALCLTLKGSGAFLWKLIPGAESALVACRRAFGWSDRDVTAVEVMSDETLPGWIPALSSGAHIAKTYGTMTAWERALLSPKKIFGVLAVPILIKGDFWGFISLNRTLRRRFEDEEISVLSASGLLIVSGVMEKEMTDRLIVAREEALAGARSKSDFLSRMSHEIRTPMNAIIGMTKIADTTDDLAKLRYCLSTIDASSTHLLSILNDVLDMAKIEADKFDLDHAPLDIEKMLIKISNIMSDKVSAKNLKLNVLLGRGLRKRYIGDELRLSQIITNLLSNAVKFTPENGAITVYVAEVAQTRGATVLRFSVEDTGIGIAPEQVGKLFHAFEQANTGITQRFGGTGLGLTISKSIVEKMNGKIWVESELGKGSKFIFEAELAHDPNAPPNVPFTFQQLRILIVDDNELPKSHFGTQFKQVSGLNFNLTTDRAGAAERLESARAEGQPYAVVFLAYGVPGIDSAQGVSDLIRGLDVNTVVIMTSFENWNKIEPEMNRLGVTHFLSKPIFSSTMDASINEVLGIRAPDAPAPKTAADFAGASLLLVEDIDINREIFRALLENTGILIDEAVNGRDGFEKFRDNQNKYDVVVMDVQMPEMNGLESTRAIRALGTPQARSVPILAMTANAFKEDIDTCIASGMNGHLMKPIDLDSLTDALRLWLKRDG